MYMMKPNYDLHTKNKGKSKKRISRRASIKLLICFALVAILMLTAWIQEKSSAGNSDVPVLQDLTTLTEWGDKLLQSGSETGQWSFRWDLLLPRDTMEMLAEKMFRTEKGALIHKNIRSNGNVIDGEGVLPASYMKLVRTEQDKLAERVTITLQIDSSDQLDIAELKRYIKKLHLALQEKDHNVQMSMKVFGKAKDNSAIQTLIQHAVAQPVEEYKDRGTSSATLFSPRIKQYRWINNEKMANVQVALHESTTNGEYELTIGVPLISGEFGEIRNHSSAQDK